jgi:xylan 1,4-beta-xylosidase
VQLHRSQDLVNWKLAGRALDRKSQLDMRGNPDSSGIWAPCLSYADGLFWLVHTDVKRIDGAFKDTHNYIVTAPSIEGPWSDPVYVNSSGFDPSLYHDDDGRKWFLNMLWNHVSSGVGGQPKHPSFAGILLQEYDPKAGALVGEPTNIFAGSPHGLVEGPHLFKRNGWYYLTTAEGGTGYGHAVTMARARNIEGPYEMHPDTHLITSKDAPDAMFQRAGHGQLVETADGAFYHTHLCSRPLPGLRRSPMGRETSIQKCVWSDDGWLYLAQGGQVPLVDVPAPSGALDRTEPVAIERYDFDGDKLPLDLQWLRIPEWQRLFSLEARPGHLRLYGRESIGSWFEQALVARRQDVFDFRAETIIEFSPTTFQQAAGLTHYYNRHKFHFLAVTHDARLGRVLAVMSCPGDWPDSRLTFPLAEPISLPGEGAVRLAAEVRGAELVFQYALDGGTWREVGPKLDASVISDEGGRGEHGSFTGAFIGMAAFDTSGRGAPADFDWFSYERLTRDAG